MKPPLRSYFVTENIIVFLYIYIILSFFYYYSIYFAYFNYILFLSNFLIKQAGIIEMKGDLVECRNNGKLESMLLATRLSR